MSKLTLEMLPAREGDCLLLTYDDAGTARRILIDGGRLATYAALKERLALIPTAERELELFVVTHVDRDHIEGAIACLEDDACPVTFRDVWFNGYAHLLDPERKEEDFGGVMGERLTTALLNRPGRWNAAFERKAAYVANGIPVIDSLRGNIVLKVLSPDAAKLATLAPVWAKECAKAGIDPQRTLPPDQPGDEAFGALNVEQLALEPFEPDDAPANGSSIGLLVEYGDLRVLLGADCHVDRMLASLALLQPGGRTKLDAFKLAHHGSSYNLSKELLDRIECRRYLISTNGSYFQHPNRSAIARVLKYGGDRKELFFNYASDQTRIWDDAQLRTKYGFQAHFPSQEENGTLRVEITG